MKSNILTVIKDTFFNGIFYCKNVRCSFYILSLLDTTKSQNNDLFILASKKYLIQIYVNCFNGKCMQILFSSFYHSSMPTG